MIQIYSKGNSNYDMNGDMVLFPESCKVSAELNGTWKLDMTHPRDQEGRWKYIEEECVISVPTFIDDKQLFRICEIEKKDEEISVTALPVFLDSANDCYLMDVRPTIKNGQEALDIMTAGSHYSGESNITKVSTAYFVTRSLMDAINGSDSPTFIGRWGGEILYDNYKVIINERAGGDYGVEVRYGKNMEGIEYHLDMSDVVTRIIPMAYNGYMMSGDTPWVDSENINKYEKKYIQKIKFEDVKMRDDAQEEDEENGVIICDTQEELEEALIKRCRQQFENGLDLPVVSINVTMLALSGTEEYKDYKILETVGLGDDIACYHKELGITTKERVVVLTWDCCENRVEKVTLGEEGYDYFSNTNSSLNDIDSVLGIIGSAIDGNGSINAEKVKGFLDATKTQLRLQNSVAKKQIVRAIIFEDLDPESELYGAMALGTLGLQIAKKRTPDNRDWDWTTALTANGLIANCILTGILSDRKGYNTWNLDTGEMNMKAMSIVADSFSLTSGDTTKTIDEIAKEAAGDVLEEQTQEEIIDKLTNNGKDQGIYLLDGKLYISFDALKGRALTLGGPNNGYGIIEIFDSMIVNGEVQKLLTVDGNGLTFKKNLETQVFYSYNQIRAVTDSGEKTSIDFSVTKKGAMYLTAENGGIVGLTIPYEGNGAGSYGIFLNSKMETFREFDYYTTINLPAYISKMYANDMRINSMECDGAATFKNVVKIEGGLAKLEIDPASDFLIGSMRRMSGDNAVHYNANRLQQSASSSERYKNINRAMNEEDVKSLYDIQPVLASYKEGYLEEDDERNKKIYPMFIAEDVEKHFPTATDHNKDGSVESWNSRVMIPAMFQMLKSQKQTIDELSARLRKMELMMGGKI